MMQLQGHCLGVVRLRTYSAFRNGIRLCLICMVFD